MIREPMSTEGSSRSHTMWYIIAQYNPVVGPPTEMFYILYERY